MKKNEPTRGGEIQNCIYAMNGILPNVLHSLLNTEPAVFMVRLLQTQSDVRVNWENVLLVVARVFASSSPKHNYKEKKQWQSQTVVGFLVTRENHACRRV